MHHIPYYGASWATGVAVDKPDTSCVKLRHQLTGFMALMFLSFAI